MNSMIDLTYRISRNMSLYPGDSEPAIEYIPAENHDNRVKSGRTNLSITSHHGTHIDAPSHKIPDGKTIDEYPPEKFINHAVLVDLSEYRGRYTRIITADDLADKLKSFDMEKIGAVIIRTGYDKIIESGTRDDKYFPYVDPNAAEYLSEIGIDLLGIDSFSVDPKGSNSESHVILLSSGVLIAETLVNLDMCCRDVFELIALPVIYEGADGAQARVVARRC